MRLKSKIFFNLLFFCVFFAGTGKFTFAQNLDIKEIEDAIVDTDYGNFSFKDLEIVKNELSGLNLYGEITNNTNKNWIDSNFKVIIYDKKGNEIAESDSVSIYGLNKRESEPLKDSLYDYYDYIQLRFPLFTKLKKAKSYKIVFVRGDYSAKYNVSLKQSSRKNIPIFEDDNINIAWIFGKRQLSFILKNKTNSPIKIDWNQVSYIDVNSSAKKVIHSGVKYVNRNEHMSPTLVPPTAKIEDIIYPSDHISYISGRYGGWRERPMFPEGEEAKMYEGESFSIFMPMEVNGEVKNYTFTFDIDEVSY